MTERITKQKIAPTKRLLALGLTVTLSFSAICGWVLWHAGDRDYLHSRAAATNLVSSLASEIERNIELYDLSLQAAVDGMKLPDINRISRELKQVVLFDRAATAKDMGTILVIDRLGRVVMDSRSLVPAEANYAGHDFFQVHASRSDAGLFISRPWVAPDGQYLIGLSRRISNDDGSFGGVVAGSMRVSYFHSLFRKLNFGAKELDDAAQRGRHPSDARAVRHRHDRAEPAQIHRLQAVSQGGKRLVRDGFDPRRREAPVRLSAGRPSSDAYHQRRFARHHLCGLVAGSLADRLDHAGAVRGDDGLDGVPGQCAEAADRRRKQARFAGEHRRPDRALQPAEIRRGSFRRMAPFAADGDTPVSLLMIDADSFKAYNDAHGHQAGDAALASIAQCIAGGTRRASDLGVRYGGEEFAVLLPGETGQGAFRIAEEIRASVLSLRAQQQGRPDICPTISVGVASMIPQPGLAPSDLIKSADLALYEAKRSGRNRTVAAPTMAIAHRVAA